MHKRRKLFPAPKSYSNKIVSSIVGDVTSSPRIRRKFRNPKDKFELWSMLLQCVVVVLQPQLDIFNLYLVSRIRIGPVAIKSITFKTDVSYRRQWSWDCAVESATLKLDEHISLRVSRNNWMRSHDVRGSELCLSEITSSGARTARFRRCTAPETLTLRTYSRAGAGMQ